MNEFPWIVLLTIVGGVWLLILVFGEIFGPLFLGSIRRILITTLSILIVSFTWISLGIWGGILSLFFICLTISVWCGRKHMGSWKLLWKGRADDDVFNRND